MRQTVVVYRVSDRQVGWLDGNDVFTPIIWARTARKKGEDVSWTSVPEFKE